MDVPTARVAIATAAEFPDLDDDGPALLRALGARGIQGEPTVWTDAAVDWSSYAAVVVRCTWDYHERRDDFLDWADRVSAVTRLANATEVLRWNTSKTYLRELAAQALPVVATTWVEPGDEFELPGAGEYVVKPAVSAGSRNTNRYASGERDGVAAAHVRGLLAAGHTVMVQPYLHEIDTAGETALFYFAGEFSHAVRKGPLLEPGMELISTTYKEETIVPRRPSATERAVADRVLDSLPWSRGSLTYARVDLVPGSGGEPTLLELELTEPSMFLEFDENGRAADRFAAAIAALVDDGGSGA